MRLIADERSGGDLGTVPRGVQEAVARRLSRLPEGTAEILEAAAVIGREFTADLLAAVCERDVSGAVEAARAARIVESSRRERGAWLFAHAVFRETIYEQLDGDRRRELHRRAAEALEELCRDDPDRYLPALARHFHEAGPDFADRALAFSLAAGRQAASRLAHADAADHLERALELTSDEDAEAALDLRFELVDEMVRSGRFRDARPAILEAVGIARRVADPRRLALAATALAEIAEAGAKNEETTAILTEALELLGDDEPALRVKLLTGLAQEHYWDDITEATRVGDEAVALARALGDDGALASTLVMQQFIEVGRPGTAADRLRNADELIAIARRCGDRTSEIRGIAYRITGYMQEGDIEHADRCIAEYAALAEKLAEPRHLWHVPMIAATRELIRGNLDEARALSRKGFRLGEAAQEPLSVQFHTLQMALIHSLEGTPEEMLPSVRPMVERFPGIPAWRLALVGFLVDADRLDEARVAYEPLAAQEFASIPRDANWITGIARVAEAAAALGDVEGCRRLLGLLGPYAGEVVVVGRAAACLGPIDRFLGLLTAAIGSYDAALEHFRAADGILERMGERPFRADIRHRIGGVLLARDEPGDREAAFETLSLALGDAQEIGMRKLVERCVRMRLEAQGVAGVDVNASIDSVALAVSGERPDLGPLAAADGRVTILFSDIENSTLMTERLGDAAWIEVLRDHNAVFRSRLEQFGGYEVKSQGDGFMLAFPDPLAALECAVEVQRDFAGRDVPEEELVRVRMGLHVGEVIEEGGDFFGRSVILAARIAAQARGGEVLISEELRSSVGDQISCRRRARARAQGPDGSAPRVRGRLGGRHRTGGQHLAGSRRVDHPACAAMSGAGQN